MSKFRILVMKPLHDEAEEQAALRVIRSGWWISGPECAAFEREFGEHVGGHAVTVSSATAGMHLALEALDVANAGGGAPIVVPALTHIATADAARMLGANTVAAVTLNDVRADDLLLPMPPLDGLQDDPEVPSAILPVDLYGHLWGNTPPLGWRRADPMDLPPIIVDAAHSVGEWSLADRPPHINAYVFSFHAMKNLGVGEGGMVVTSDPVLAREVRILREHGQDRDAPDRPFVKFGFKYNMPDILAAIGRAQLKKLPGWMARRRELADRYDELLDSALGDRIKIVPRDRFPNPRLNTPHLYVIRVSDRDGVQRRMAEQGIQTLVHYKSLSVDGPYATGRGTCPNAEKAGDEVLTLPFWPGMTEAEQDEVVVALSKAIGP